MRWWVCLLSLMVGCTDRDETRLTLVFEPRGFVPSDVASLEIRVGERVDRLRIARTGSVPSTQPWTYVVLPVDAQSPGRLYGEVRVQFRSEPSWILYSLEADFVRGEQREVQVVLDARCRRATAQNPCNDSSTCASAGACIPRLHSTTRVFSDAGMDALTDSVRDSTADRQFSEGVCPSNTPLLCAGACVDDSTDVANCGVCGRDCRRLPGVDRDRVRCVARQCELSNACVVGTANCDGNADNGCELTATNSNNCGRCGNRCTDPTSICELRTVASVDGGVSVPNMEYACSNGCLLDAPDRCGGMCVNTQTSNMHCGRCNNPCTDVSGATRTCQIGMCRLQCNGTRGDCDGDAANGCETETQTSLQHCGMCGRACPVNPANASVACSSGRCVLACTSPFQDCDMMAATGCEVNTRTSTMHCGACGRACSPPPNATATCTNGTCGFSCNTGFMLSVGVCVSMPVRPIAPLTTSTVTKRQPRFRWALSAESDGGQVQICSDRMCTMVVDSFMATGTSAAPSSPLEPGRYWWRVRGTRMGTAATDYSAPWLFYVPAREGMPNTSFGVRLDVNGDGYGDVAVSATDTTMNLDAVYVYSGSPMGLGPTPTTRIALPMAMNPIQFGSSIAPAGDVNGDGFVDLLIADRVAGRVYVYHGTPTGLSSSIGSTIPTAASSVEFGSSVAPAGDVNGDGYADVLIGAPGAMPYAYVYFGSASGVTTMGALRLEGSFSSRFGEALWSAGDVNGDGLGDVVVGAPRENRAYLFVSRSATMPLIAGTAGSVGVLLQDVSLRALGTSVVGGADLNSDGYSDLVLGAPDSNAIQTWLGDALNFRPGTTPTGGRAIMGPSGAMGFGTSVSMPGDLNGDGFSDTVVGSPGNSRAYAYIGSLTGLPSPAVPYNTLTQSGTTQFGRVLGAPGDVDGNGRFDVVVGAATGGAVTVFRGDAVSFPQSSLTQTLAPPIELGIPVPGFGISVAARSRSEVMLLALLQ